MEFARGSCGQLSGSCGTPPRPAPRATAPTNAISRVVEKYNSLGGASGADAASPQAVNGQSVGDSEQSHDNVVLPATNGKA